MAIVETVLIAGIMHFKARGCEVPAYQADVDGQSARLRLKWK